MIVRSYNPIWSLVDLNGLQLDDTYYLFTLQNTLPYLPSPIWQDSSKVVTLSDPIQFLANGTLPENMYWDNTLIYRLEIRKGNTQADPLIYLVENYQPGSANSGPSPTSGSQQTENQITNPQFATVNFVGDLIINTATTTVIAPGWSIITTGSGTLTLRQVTYSGSQSNTENPTNAATGLRIINNGFNTVELIQRFNGNGALWTGAQSASATGPGVAFNITGSATTPSTFISNIKYNDSGQNTPLLTQDLSTVNTEYRTAKIILKSTNVTLPDVAWTELSIVLTTNTTYEFTSIQIVAQPVVAQVAYLQTTPQRQVDEEFNYYSPLLQYKPIPSFLTGWDFPLNPAQFGVSGVTGAIGANKSAYAWDQTILFSTVNSGLQYNRGGGDSGKGFIVQPSSNTSWAMIQYIPLELARRLLSDNQCVQIRAKTSSGTVNGTVSLWFTTDGTLPVMSTGVLDSNGNSLVSLITAGVPTAGNGNWTAVSILQGQNNFTLTTSMQSLSFAGWQPNAATSTATFAAIVVCFDTTLTTQQVSFEYVSLQEGSIPTRPAPKTQIETLSDCYYYCQSTYDLNVTPGVSSAPQLSSPRRATQGIFNINVPPPTVSAFALSWSLQYELKRTIPRLNIYSPFSGAIATVYSIIFNAGAQLKAEDIVLGTWLATATGPKATYYSGQLALPYSSVAGAGVNSIDAFILYHAFIDARFGVVV
jgi:hypothetical protein